MTPNALGTGAALSFLVLGSLTACSDDGPGPSPSASSSATSASPDGGSSTPSEPTSTGPEAASGVLLETPNARLHAPAGMKPDPQNKYFKSSSQSALDGGDVVSLGDLGTSGKRSLQSYRKLSLTQPFEKGPKLSYDATVGGEPAYRAEGISTATPFVQYGAIHPVDGDYAYVTISFFLGGSKAEREKTIESVLASFEWK